ncbi:MAG: 50S ribosomal protein L6 [Pseudomonadota bacterium]
MSRIGKKPIKIPKGVDVAWQDNVVTVKGPKGSLTREIMAAFSLEKDGETLVVKFPRGREKDKAMKGLFGLTRTLLANMVTGVSEGFSRTLEFVGTGYKVEAKGKNAINIEVGFSHKVDFPLPEGIEARIGEKNLKVTIVGADKEVVGQVAANIRKLRPPEPYKGKGVRYQGEVIKMKAGKAGKAASSGGSG